MKHKLIIFSIAIGVAMAACSKIEPIRIIAPQRPIDTQGLEQFKTIMETRKVSMGMVYGWGKNENSNLMHTPDSLDIIIVKDGYGTLSDHQKKDLAEVQTQKATRVLLGVNLEASSQQLSQLVESTINARKKTTEETLRKNNPSITDQAVKVELHSVAAKTTREYAETVPADLSKIADSVKTLLQQYQFDGISVEIPQNFTALYQAEAVATFLQSINQFAGKGKGALLIIENPFTEGADIIKEAQWVVYRNVTNNRLANFDALARNWPDSRVVASVDFSREEQLNGFADSETFSSTGILPQAIDVVNWKFPTRAGVAYYHIEKNYSDIDGKVSYKTLRYSISKLQVN